MASLTVAARTDREIQDEVLEELAWDTTVQANEIGVIVKDHVVTLTGTVDSYAKRWAAQQAAHRVRGVTAVANDIEVRLSTTAERTDAELAGACLSALKWDAAVSTAALDVTVSKGWVTLSGEVDWNAQRESAERAVRRLSGVIGVTNLLAVKHHPAPADVKQRIERALIRSAEIDAKRITVEIHNSAAVLHGTVRSYAEKRAAEHSAWSAPGITRVDNQINIVVPV